MKKVSIILILVVVLCVNSQCYHNADSRVAVFLKENESQMEKLRGWNIDYHPEIKCWECKHWYREDSLLAHISVQAGVRDNDLSYSVHQLHEDSATAMQIALSNINTLKEIKHIYGSKYIDADEVCNDVSNAGYCIYVENNSTLSQIMLVGDSNNNHIGKHLYRKWYIRNIDPTTRLSAYLEENKSQMELLRGWEILYVRERDCWWCRHWYTRDSLLSFILVRLDAQDNITSCETGQLYEDSTKASQDALQNISTLYDIKRIYSYKFMGAHEVALFNDTLEYDYIIGTGDETTTYSIMLCKSDNTINGQLLYNNWYLKKNYITDDNVLYRQ